MKTIYLVRHAKSSWDFAGTSDEQRQLLEKGRERTRKVADYLLEKHTKIDYIVSSHAIRAYETAKILAHSLKYPVEKIKVDSHIYHASADTLLDKFYSLPDNLDSVMIVGHNPYMTEFVNFFLDNPIENLPTSGVVSFSFDTNHWENMSVAPRKTKFVLIPKELEE